MKKRTHYKILKPRWQMAAHGLPWPPRHLPVRGQCNLLGISRTAYYYKGKRNINKKEIELSKEIINTLEKIPFYGYRKIS